MRLLDGPSRCTVNADLLEVEVVYARPEQQVLIQLSVPGGSTVRDAIIRSNILSDVPDSIWKHWQWGSLLAE